MNINDICTYKKFQDIFENIIQGPFTTGDHHHQAVPLLIFDPTETTIFETATFATVFTHNAMAAPSV